MPVGFGFGRRPPQENVLGSSARFGCVRVRARVRVNVFVRVRVRVRVRRKKQKVAQEAPPVSLFCALQSQMRGPQGGAWPRNNQFRTRHDVQKL